MKRSRALASRISGLALLFGAASATAGDITGRAHVLDGDSLRIDELEIRLRGIDAPEYRQTCVREGRSHRCGIDAWKGLKQMLGSNPVRCTWSERDNYARALATCYVDGENINARLVAAGLALAYTRYSDRYADEQAYARNQSIGLWSMEFTSPWQWRREHPRGELR